MIPHDQEHCELCKSIRQLDEQRPDLRTVVARPTKPDRPTPIENYSERMKNEIDDLCHVQPVPAASVLVPGNQAQKADAGKLPMSRLPWGPLKVMLKVLVHGREKYGKWDGWQEVENAQERYTDALVRHVADYCMGVREDPDSHLPTLGHVLCDAAFLLWFAGFKK